ncbi:MAG: hypothetical protein ACLR78_03460 [Roseburia sp.]
MMESAVVTRSKATRSIRGSILIKGTETQWNCSELEQEGHWKIIHHFRGMKIRAFVVQRLCSYIRHAGNGMVAGSKKAG